MVRVMQRTTIYLEQRQMVVLDRLAAAEGVSRAEVIRRLLDRALVGSEDIADNLAAIKMSFGSTLGIEAPERAPRDRELRHDTAWRQTS